MTRDRILLLHPPSGPKHAYQLDGYCSQPQKGPFRWHPIELCVFSGRWSPDADVEILDLGTRRPTLPLDRLRDYDAVVGLVGACGWIHHRAFWRAAIQAGARVYLSGDVARHEPRYVFRELPGLAGILPELAAAPSVAELLSGGSPSVWTPESPTYTLPRPEGVFRLGVQRFDLWEHRLYRLPFAKAPFASVVTQVGCPHRCDYCILSAYRVAHRDLDELSRELDALRHGGARHVYVRDATLNGSARHLEGVCERLARCGLPWNAFARADGIGEHASMLAESGCRVLMLGLDSPDPGALGRHGKLVSSALGEELAAIRRAGIQTVGHFVLGLGGDTSTGRDIVRYARALGLHWLTVSPLMVRPGTALWRGPELMSEGAALLEGDARRDEVATALRSFYLRPSALLRATRTLGRSPGLAVRAARALLPALQGRVDARSPHTEETSHA